MNKIFKIIFCFQFFILGCAPNAIEDNKVILKKIESFKYEYFFQRRRKDIFNN